MSRSSYDRYDCLLDQMINTTNAESFGVALASVEIKQYTIRSATNAINAIVILGQLMRTSDTRSKHCKFPVAVLNHNRQDDLSFNTGAASSVELAGGTLDEDN